ncbi:DUF1254 domain-containing protein [Weissella viridescens]|nr:DUF1254 domain-containing protein [Weissella viridescens]
MDNLQDLANEAYVYGLPLVYNLDQIKKSVEEGFGTNPAVPYNEFSYAQSLSDASDKFVSVNNDTVYNNAQLDLSAGPLYLEIPAMGDRYYVFLFVDAWTDNYAYIGQRSIGGNGGKFMITPPDFTGKVTEGYTQIKSPSRFGEIVGRIAVTDDADMDKVKAIQKQLTLTQATPENKVSGIPTIDNSDPLAFWKKFKAYYDLSAPADRYKPLIEKYRQLGIFEDELPQDHLDVLKEALTQGPAQIKHFLENVPFPIENGWQKDFHVFDYNFDYFELGSIESDEWEMPHSTEKELVDANFVRAAAAIGGLWGNQSYEAVYLLNYLDGDKKQLNGANNYEIHFEQTPPNNAFWSITMYQTEGFTLIENPINRYSIGDRTKGLQKDADGGITIKISNEEPSELASNWLPSPKGDFRPILRVYLPDESVINGDYHFPAIKKVK